MKKDIFAVCDPEAEYTERLMEYIHKKHGSAFEVQAFTSVQSLCEFAVKQPISVLLISAHIINERVQLLPIEKIIILSEGEVIEELSSFPTVYKYQASDAMISEVMSCYAAERRQQPMQLLKRKMKVIGVYSPVNRVLKTSFALTMGQVLARERGVLYLNMESYSGFETLMKKEFQADLSDLMYFVRRESANLVYKLQGTVHSLDNLDYIPPFLSPEDLKSITIDEWLELIHIIESYTTYEIVLMDIGEAVNGIFNLLERCDIIYMPVREDALSAAKLSQYEKVLKLNEYENIREKTKKLKLPFHNSFGLGEHYIEQLMWGELGDFVRKLVREEAKNGRTEYSRAVTQKALGEDGTDGGSLG